MTQLGEQITRICHRRNEEGSRVAFPAGIDGKVIVKSYQVPFYHGFVVGGAYPNKYFPIKKVKGEGLRIFLQECLDGLHRKLASEIKVCIISFQNNPQGMFP